MYLKKNTVLVMAVISHLFKEVMPDADPHWARFFRQILVPDKATRNTSVPPLSGSP